MYLGLDRVSSETQDQTEDRRIADILGDPRWFPERFDPRSGTIHYVASDRNTLASQTFLDGRWDRSNAERRAVSGNTALAYLSAEKPRPNFIWHTGFCGSSLLAKALDYPGRNLSLCEPQILADIANAKRMATMAPGFSERIPNLVLQLLARPFATGECVTLKPSPVANNLLREAAAFTSGPMLFLYSDCRSFLISIAKKGEEGHKYVRRMFVAMLADGHEQAQWPPGKVLSLTDLEMATVVWHMHIGEILRHCAALGPARAVSLDCDAFLTKPVECLRKLDAFFSLDLGVEYPAQAAAGPLFRRNAKTPEVPFDADKRRDEHSRTAQSLGPDLDRIVAQSYDLCRTTPRGMPLPDPLVALDKTYF